MRRTDTEGLRFINPDHAKTIHNPKARIFRDGNITFNNDAGNLMGLSGGMDFVVAIPEDRCPSNESFVIYLIDPAVRPDVPVVTVFLHPTVSQGTAYGLHRFRHVARQFDDPRFNEVFVDFTVTKMEVDTYPAFILIELKTDL